MEPSPGGMSGPPPGQRNIRLCRRIYLKQIFTRLELSRLAYHLYFLESKARASYDSIAQALVLYRVKNKIQATGSLLLSPFVTFSTLLFLVEHHFIFAQVVLEIFQKFSDNHAEDWSKSQCPP